MRLSKFEQKSIFEILKQNSNPNTKIYLFGSRTDPLKNGGDIDLLIVFTQIEFKSQFKRLDFIVELIKKIGDRKIDITLATEDELVTDLFLKSIVDSAVEIKP